MIIKKVSTKEEQNDAYTVRKKVFVEEQGVSVEEEIDGHEDEAIHFVGYKNNSPIAASRLRFLDQVGKLERLCILKDERGHSYGSKMIEAMEAEIYKKSYPTAKLNAQTHAIQFYERFGYQVTSEEFLDAGIPHVTMIKKML